MSDAGQQVNRAERAGGVTPRSLHRLDRRHWRTICNALWLASEWEKSICSAIPHTSKEYRDRKRAARKYLALRDKLTVPSIVLCGGTPITTMNTPTNSEALPLTNCSAPVYSSKPEVAAIELLDGAYDIIEIYKAESPSQKAWKAAWLSKARELGANPSW